MGGPKSIKTMSWKCKGGPFSNPEIELAPIAIVRHVPVMLQHNALKPEATSLYLHRIMALWTVSCTGI